MVDVDRLVSCLVAHLDTVEQAAEAAGHGFGQFPIGTPLNAGWTELDLTRNSRPTYDQRFVREFDPRAVLGLVRATRDLIAQWRRYAGEVERLKGRGADTAVEQVELARVSGVFYGLSDTVRGLARGWGVGTDDKEGTGQ